MPARTTANKKTTATKAKAPRRRTTAEQDGVVASNAAAPADQETIAPALGEEDQPVSPPSVAANEIEASAEVIPEEALLFLLRNVPIRELWQWLNEQERAELLQRSTRGFQRTPNTLRQPVVRSRLVHHLREHPDDFRFLLCLWSDATPLPHVVEAVRESTADADLIDRLSTLWQDHGTEPLLLALLRDNRQAAIDAWETLVDESPPEAALDGEENVDPENLTGSIEAVDELATLSAELEAARGEVELWRGRSHTWQQRAEAAEAQFATQRDSARRERDQLNRQLKQEANRAEVLAAQLQETRRLYDRTSRRLKSVEAELSDATADSKRLKRQVRQQQQLNEELRKQLANITARLDASVASIVASSEAKTAHTPSSASESPAKAPPPAPTISRPGQTAATARPASALDQLFIWQSDGRQFKLTPREIQRAIDRNDEDFVFTLIQSLDAMRETSAEGYKLLIARVREIGRYYSRVLTADTTRVLVDASNVARFEKDKYGKGQLRHLLGMREELRRRDCFPIVMYADASLPYNIDEPAEFHKMVKSGEIQMALSGQEADELLAREARRTGAYVVTNDRGFHLKVSPDFEPPRVSFRIYDGAIIVDDF